MTVPRLLLLCSGVLLLLATGCETYTCRSACTRIYDECEMTPVRDCDTAEISTVDCNDAAAWREHQRDECIRDCERALYTPHKASEEQDDDRVELHDEDDAARFIDCAIEHELDNCKADYPIACPWVRW